MRLWLQNFASIQPRTSPAKVSLPPFTRSYPSCGSRPCHRRRSFPGPRHHCCGRRSRRPIVALLLPLSLYFLLSFSQNNPTYMFLLFLLFLLFFSRAYFLRDVLEEKSEKTKIAWPKNAQPKMLWEPACIRSSTSNSSFLAVSKQKLGTNNYVAFVTCLKLYTMSL